MDVPKVPPPQAVDQVAAVLDSPEVARLIETLEAVRWTGRPGFPVRAMVGMCLVKSLYAIPTWSRACRLVAEHTALQAVLGCAPSQWACYRFAKMLRTRDAWALEGCIRLVLGSLHEQHPGMGEAVAIDGSNMPAYASGREKDRWGNPRKLSDPDASWGHRTAVSNRPSGTFYGYKIHAAVDVATDLPVAWTVKSARESEFHFAVGLIDKARAHGFAADTAIMDAGYDSGLIHARCEHRKVTPIIPLVQHHNERDGAGDPPHCAHGEWPFAGADYQRQATKWRCPTGECEAKSMWVKASRLHPLVPRNSKRWRDLYRQRSAAEREFGRLKHEWALLPLRTRGIGRVQLHADLTILTTLACRLATDRTRQIPLAA